MNITKVTAVYFSATGNTQKVATALSQQVADALGLELEVYNFTLPRARKEVLTFGENDLVIVATPTYAGRIPNVLVPYLSNRVLGNGALAVPVITFGNRNFDDSLIELRDILETNGFHTIAGGAFIGEHAFSTILAAGRPDEKDMQVVEQLGELIVERTKNPPTGPVAVRGEQPIRPHYMPRDRNGAPINILKVKPKTTEHCTECGICADECPMGAISQTDFSEVPGTCIKCCACEKKCPIGAKYFDDPGYMYHRSELEQEFSRRAEPEIF